MEPKSIPCSVGILTLNRVTVLGRALESLRAFRDVYLCDGNSLDGTQELAAAHGIRVEKQFDTDEPNQRLTDFGAMRTRCVNQAKEDWYFRLDSDEELSPEAAKEIREIVTDPHPAHRVWKIPKKYVVHGKVIDQAITYPNFETRLFDRHAIFGYTKATHERVEVKPGYTVGRMASPMLTPLPDTYEAFWKKFESGLHYDAIQHKNIGLYSWLYGTGHVIWSCLKYSVKLVQGRLSAGEKMPLIYEWARYRYQGRVWLIITKAFFTNVWRLIRT